MAAWQNSGEPLPAEAEILPDGPPVIDGKIRWSAGALDGVFGHHMGAGGDESPVEAIMVALKNVLRKPQRQYVERLYSLLSEDSPLNYIDALLSAIAQDQQLPAQWLATRDVTGFSGEFTS